MTTVIEGQKYQLKMVALEEWLFDVTSAGTQMEVYGDLYREVKKTVPSYGHTPLGDPLEVVVINIQNGSAEIVDPHLYDTYLHHRDQNSVPEENGRFGDSLKVKLEGISIPASMLV